MEKKTARPDPKPGEVWKHTRSGVRYLILHIAVQESTLAEAVVYRRLDSPESLPWVRNKRVFMARLNTLSGKLFRFTKVEEAA